MKNIFSFVLVINYKYELLEPVSSDYFLHKLFFYVFRLHISQSSLVRCREPNRTPLGNFADHENARISLLIKWTTLQRFICIILHRIPPKLFNITLNNSKI